MSFFILNEVSSDITNCSGKNMDKKTILYKSLFKSQITKISDLKRSLLVGFAKLNGAGYLNCSHILREWLKLN